MAFKEENVKKYKSGIESEMQGLFWTFAYKFKTNWISAKKAKSTYEKFFMLNLKEKPFFFGSV